MNKSQVTIQKYQTAAWGMLAVLWGATILFDFIPFGAGLVGTGLIFLGANAVRAANRIPMRGNNSAIGSLMLAWGGLEIGRPLLRPLFPAADLDWVIFAILLMGGGITLLARVGLHGWKPDFGQFAEAHKEE